MPTHGVAEPQRKYVATMARNLEKNSGRTLSEWLLLARECPESAPRARLFWFKETYGLQQNYALRVFDPLKSVQEKGRAQSRAAACAASLVASSSGADSGRAHSPSPRTSAALAGAARARTGAENRRPA